MSLRFTRIRDVESPKRGNPDDAGIDYLFQISIGKVSEKSLRYGM
jgi:hypothetical protein